MDWVFMLCRMRHNIKHVECRIMPDGAVAGPFVGSFVDPRSA